MELHHLVEAVLAGDLLTARQWVTDARRIGLDWNLVACPHNFSAREMAVAAGLVELLARRAGKQPPAWTDGVGAEREPVVLDPGLEQMPRSFARAQTAGPEPLRKRNLFALPDFLDVA